MITLRDEKFKFTPAGFYIAGVTDEREDKSTVASLVYKDEAHGYASRSVDLRGGAAGAVGQFLSNNLGQDKSLRPVVISIKEFKLIETTSANGMISGQLTIGLAFGLQKNYGVLHLVDYSGGLRYNRPENQNDAAEPALRHAIENALTYFNTWINGQAETNPMLAKQVKVEFKDYTEKAEGDTIYYAVSRPLTKADFREKSPGGKYEAEIFTSIGYAEQSEVKNGVISIYIALKVSLPKNDCLVKSGSMSDEVLNHEQRHFDIEKIIAERFRKKILAMDLPVDNFDGPINVEYLETLREANRMQKQYDSETRHGTDHDAQQQWDEKIDAELKKFGIKS